MLRALERPWPRVGLFALVVVVCATFVPRAWCGRGANALFRGDREAQESLARAVAHHIEAGVGASAFRTGSARFDGEWGLATYQMAALGLMQVALAHPELQADLVAAIETCAERVLDPATTAFGTEAWGERGLDALSSANGHAYLGYANLALGALRVLSPRNRFAAQHDRLTEALARRLEASPHGVLETYPRESYPADIAAVVGSIGLYDRATGSDHRALLATFDAQMRARCIDTASGLAFQSIDAATGRPTGPPRASGTAIAVYFLSFADPPLARDLFDAMRRSQRASFLGFGGVREYALGHAGGGDVDSGPVLFGVGVTASAFSLAGARMFGDRDLYETVYRTANLFGGPVDIGTRRPFTIAGSIGNAILLAMLTAMPVGP